MHIFSESVTFCVFASIWTKKKGTVRKTADFIILTTCGVTQMHEDFTFQMLERIKEGMKPGARIILGDCAGSYGRDICNELGFDWIFCHGFSARPGTPASELPDQYSETDVTARAGLFKDMITDRESVVLDFE